MSDRRPCIVPGCPAEGRNKLGVRCRVWHDGPYPRGKGKTAALWAPDADAFLCDEHALGGATITMLYEAEASGATTVTVVGARHVPPRSVPIKDDPPTASPRNGGEPEPSRRPPSFLLRPAAGEDSSWHFQEAVERAVAPRGLDAWCPGAANDVRARVRDHRLAAWGLRDNTRGFPSQGLQPMIWDRIEIGTLALFSDSEEYFRAATVIGKCTSEQGSEELWGSPEFRWLIFLTDVRRVSVPIAAVVRGAEFAPTYRINRQAIVPREHREPGLWEVLQRHGI
jgi:hypothetical protein